MQYDFAKFKKRAEEVDSWLDKEFSGIRTGQANPAILDSVIVDVYESRMPLNQLATITVSDPRSLIVSPWDVSVIKNIEKAIHNSNLGLSLRVNEAGIRINFPELTTERRNDFVKLIRQKSEQAKVSLRSERERVLDDIRKISQEGEISEDEKFRFKDEMQKLLDGFVKEVERKTEKKEKELKEI